MSKAAARAAETAWRESRIFDFTVASMTEAEHAEKKFCLTRRASRRAADDSREESLKQTFAFCLPAALRGVRVRCADRSRQKTDRLPPSIQTMAVCDRTQPPSIPAGSCPETPSMRRARA